MRYAPTKLAPSRVAAYQDPTEGIETSDNRRHSVHHPQVAAYQDPTEGIETECPMQVALVEVW